MAIKDNIKELRKKDGITQKELALSTGLSLSSIISYENGLREPNSKAMVALENFFGVSGDYLRGNITFEEERQNEEIKVVKQLFSNELNRYIVNSMKEDKATRQIANDILLTTFKFINNRILGEGEKRGLPKLNIEEYCDEKMLQEITNNIEFLSIEGISKLIEKLKELCTNQSFIIDITKKKNYMKLERIKSSINTIGEEDENCIEIPLYDTSASAGTGIDIDYTSSEPIKVSDEYDEAYFAVRVSGDSMEPRYVDGDIVIVEPAVTIDEGETGIFILNGQAFIKKLGTGCLISLNKKYDPIQINEYDSIYCQGRVIGVIPSK